MNEAGAPTRELLREDAATYGRLALARPGFYALLVHRLATYEGGGAGAFARAASKPLALLVRAVFGIEISTVTRIGRRFQILHQGGIVVGAARIGDDCVVRQNVTIGQATYDGPRPVLGDRVDVGAGAVLVGGIRIGDDVKIGPNAVVTRNVPARSVVVAPPARIIPGRAPVDAA